MPVIFGKDLSNDLFEVLHNLSNCKGDYGFSFMVRTDYLLGYLSDVETDIENKSEYSPKAYKEVCELKKKLGVACAVFVCCDEYFKICSD